MARKDRAAVNEGLDSLLGGEDLLSNIISGDRKRTGRGTPAPQEEPENGADYDNHTRHNVIGQSDIMTSTQTDGLPDKRTDTQADKPANGQTDGLASGHTDNETSSPTDTPLPGVSEATGSESATSEEAMPPRPAPKRREKKDSRETASEEDPLARRRDEATEMAKSATMTVTLRIPTEMNQWLDEYVHRSWPEKVKKQELVIEGLKLLIARRGRAGEAVLPTELLGGEEG